MENVKIKYKDITDSLITVHQALEIIQDPENAHLYVFLRDSVIKRFEYSLDAFWKFLKVYMQERLLLSIDSTLSPRQILREALKIHLIIQEELEVLVEAVADRNLTSHTYRESIAQEVYEAVPGCYKVMKAIVDRVKV